MISKNAIERTMENENLKEKYGDTWQAVLDGVLSRNKLDEEKDEPLPAWAITLLKESKLSYRTRFRILTMHHFDITHEVGSWTFMTKKDVRNAPAPVPRWLHDFREKQSQKAKEMIDKMNSKESENK